MAAVVGVYLMHLRSNGTAHFQSGIQSNSKNAAIGNAGTGESPHQVEANKTIKVFRTRPDQVLASVNGTPITLSDLIPLQSTNDAEQEMDPLTYNYFLQRAINRELIMQTAKTRGITTTEAQQDQLDKLRAVREQPYPGLVSQLTVNPVEIEFELRDEQAFMLQTSLMAATGLTPDVTPDQVEQYYQQRVDQFGELPADPQARQQAWQTIDFQIRQTLADAVRTEYQQELNVYMSQLKARANIVVTPLTESQIAPQTGS
jgi:hypothetical protein